MVQWTIKDLVAGNYGNSSGVNDTIFSLPESIGNWTGLRKRLILRME